MELLRLLGGRGAVHPPDNCQSAGWKAGRIAVAILTVSSLLFLQGCRQRSNEPTAEIRVVNTVPDADDIQFYVANKSAFGTTDYGGASKYVKIPTGKYTVGVAANKAGQPVSYFAPFILDAEPDHRYTGIVVGNAIAWPHAKVVLLEDPAPDPDVSDQQAYVRVVDAYPHSTNIDVIINNIVAFHNLAFGEHSDSLLLPSGDCQVKAIQAGTYSDPMAGPLSVDLSQDKSFTIVILGPDTSDQNGILLLPDN